MGMAQKGLVSERAELLRTVKGSLEPQQLCCEEQNDEVEEDRGLGGHRRKHGEEVRGRPEERQHHRLILWWGGLTKEFLKSTFKWFSV